VLRAGASATQGFFRPFTFGPVQTAEDPFGAPPGDARAIDGAEEIVGAHDGADSGALSRGSRT